MNNLKRPFDITLEKFVIMFEYKKNIFLSVCKLNVNIVQHFLSYLSAF